MDWIELTQDSLQYAHDFVGWDNVVGIAICYGLDGMGSNPGGVRFSAPLQISPWGPPSLLYNGYQVIPKGKVAGGVALTTHLHLAPRLKKV